MIINLIKALVVGFMVGISFSFFKLPIPAPNKLDAIFGIMGLYFGWLIYNIIKNKWFK